MRPASSRAGGVITLTVGDAHYRPELSNVTWPQASHTGALALYPAAYEQRVIAFFDAVLLDNFLRPPKTSEVLETSEVFNPPLRPAVATTLRA